MSRGRSGNRGSRAGWSVTSLVLSWLTICPLAAQEIDPPNTVLPLHAKVSSQGNAADQLTGPAGVRRNARRSAAIRPAAFQETIPPGPATGPVLIYDGDFPPAGAMPSEVMPSEVVGPGAVGPCGPVVCPPCAPLNCEMTQERRWYMERHFGPGSVAQADGMARFEPSYSCIDNNFYAPVAPPSPFMPLGGDSPFPDSWTSWFHKSQPAADPFDDPACPDPDAAPAPAKAGSTWFPGTGWYPNGSPCYLGNCFEKHGGNCGRFWSWIWKHNTAQYMWENFHLFAGPQGFKSPTDLFQDGNFGLHEGLNWGMPVWDDIGLGYQKGFQFTQNNWNGGTGSSVFNHYRSQFWVTAGLFHRPIAGVGVQGGLAIDYLNDTYYTKINLTQLRGEISYLGPGHNEIGVWATQHSIPQAASRPSPCRRRRSRPRINTTSSCGGTSPRGPAAGCGAVLPATATDWSAATRRFISATAGH